MNAVVASTVLSSIFLVIQTTWMKNGLFWGVIPDFCLLVILWVAYNNKNDQGVVTGFISGVVCDLLSSSPMGYFSFLYVIPAYAATFLRKIVAMDAFFIPVLLGFAGTILKGIGSLFLLAVYGSETMSAYSFSNYHFWIEAALNGAIAPLLFWGLSRIRRFLITKKVTE
ncbi:MAG TPA: rod shape-determining protein MreD [Rectinemataceae bacterium]|nr:rod shape-determining protein MreD [Rectinemataceae bacterium]